MDVHSQICPIGVKAIYSSPNGNPCLYSEASSSRSWLFSPANGSPLPARLHGINQPNRLSRVTKYPLHVEHAGEAYYLGARDPPGGGNARTSPPPMKGSAPSKTSGAFSSTSGDRRPPLDPPHT